MNIISNSVCVDTAFEILKEYGAKSKTYFAVYVDILRHRDTNNNECTPSIELIHKETNISVRTIKESLTELESHGYLLIDSGKNGNSNSYYFPKEDFFKEWLNDPNQQNAKRRFFKKSKYKGAKQAGIYLITNTESNRKYVGQAIDIRERWKQHIKALRNNSHYNKELQDDFNKYGEDCFDFKVLETVDDSPVLDIELDRKEKKWGNKYNVLKDGYNKATFIDPFS